MNVRAAKAGLAIQEIPSYEHLRLHGMSNLKVFRDGMRIARFIVRERFLSQARRARQPEVSPGPKLVSAPPPVPTETKEQISAVDRNIAMTRRLQACCNTFPRKAKKLATQVNID